MSATLIGPGSFFFGSDEVGLDLSNFAIAEDSFLVFTGADGFGFELRFLELTLSPLDELPQRVDVAGDHDCDLCYCPMAFDGECCPHRSATMIAQHPASLGVY